MTLTYWYSGIPLEISDLARVVFEEATVFVRLRKKIAVATRV